MTIEIPCETCAIKKLCGRKKRTINTITKIERIIEEAYNDDLTAPIWCNAHQDEVRDPADRQKAENPVITAGTGTGGDVPPVLPLPVFWDGSGANGGGDLPGVPAGTVGGE